MAKKNPERIHEIMERKVESLTPEAELHDAVRVLLKRGYSGAPVTKSAGTLLGMFSEHDSIKVLADAVYDDWPPGAVADHMTTEIDALDPDDSLSVAVKRFSESRHRSLPVVSGGKVVGLLGRGMLMRALDRMLDRGGPKTTYDLMASMR